MARLLGIRIQNFRGLRDVTLGQIGYGMGTPLPPLVCCIGPNGSGKSTLLDAFGFLADCLREGVEAACDKPHRGGYERLRTQGAIDPIRFRLYYREQPSSRPITYELAIGLEGDRPVVTQESLQQRRKGQKHGQPFPFLRLTQGKGAAWSGQSSEGDEAPGRLDVELDDVSRLAITTLGQLKEHPRILGLRSFIEAWYLSYFVPEAARGLPPSGAQRRLDRTGANLGNYLQYLRRHHGDRLDDLLQDVSRRIPGIQSISCKDSEDRRLLIQFDEKGFEDPFFQMNMSDGTLKMLAYMLLLQDPEPSPLIGIEEPENGLYHRLLPVLAEELLDHARRSDRTQVFVTTHSPAFVDALTPDLVWLLEKDSVRGVTARRTADIDDISHLHGEGIPLGSLWFSRHLGETSFEDV
jgi:predicted ATPase